ncbi:MAG: glycogen-debranching protein [Planctomycetaceae bacterium]
MTRDIANVTNQSTAADHSWDAAEGALFPLGAVWLSGEKAWNFVLYSKNAERVQLCFFSEADLCVPAYCFDFDYLRNKTGPLWHCRILDEQLMEARYYAYRVDGPAPKSGFDYHTFDFQKLLIDPYAKSLFFPPTFSREAARLPGDNARQAALCVLEKETCGFDWPQKKPNLHQSDLVIYELHVRGFTRHHSSGVTNDRRGTFAGVVDKIPHLLDLGVTAVELMPVFQFDPNTNDFWGYMPISFFAPQTNYTSNRKACTQRNEFRHMVDALHAADIEVILDVVYNHTGEGNEVGPTYNLKGIDNSTYYMLSQDADQPYCNYSGTGNTLHTANRAVRRLILDSLRYWHDEMGVDGFRFDLASVFTRDSDGSINLKDPPIFAQIAADPALADVRLIAEPWDSGGTFQLGNRFPGIAWMQWNSHFRDTLQRFVRGDPGMVPELMTRLYGSSDLFPDDRLNACRPFQSVNYVASHDGLTMADLVSFDRKQNWANGHDNTDGHVDFSSSCGWNGLDAPPAVLRQRKQLIKNFCCLLLLSNGSPMFRAGDEFLQTQCGNSNPYNQDNDTTWLDWSLLETNADLFRFFKQMIAFRKAHPSISRSRFWRDDIRWYGVDHEVDMTKASQQLSYCLHGASQGDDDLYVLINAGDTAQEFGLYEGPVGSWNRIVDTSLGPPDDIVTESCSIPVDRQYYSVNPTSVVILVSNGTRVTPSIHS